MDWKWAGRTAVVAAATAALALAVALPMAGIADEPQSKEVKVAEAALNNCTVELYARKLPYVAGEKPELFLNVTGRSDDSDEVEVTVTVLGARPGSEMSRMVVLPSTLWTHKLKCLVLPGETAHYDLPVDITTPEGQSLLFRMQAGPQKTEARNVAPVTGYSDAPSVGIPAMQQPSPIAPSPVSVPVPAPAPAAK